MTSLLEDAERNIWSGTRGGLCVKENDVLRLYTTEQGLTSNNINDLALDQHGQLWIGTWGGGVNIWNGSSFSRLTHKENLPGDHITKVFTGSHGDIWIGTAGAGLIKWTHQETPEMFCYCSAVRVIWGDPMEICGLPVLSCL